MNLYCIKCLMITKNKNTKIKHKTVEKINLHSHSSNVVLLFEV